MLFLQKIDELHQNNRDKYLIPLEDKSFSSFIPVSLSCGEISYSFLIKKQNKSKLLITCGKQRVYLSDIQILKTILTMPDDDISWFISQFVLLCNGEGKPIAINIDGENYFGCGIDLYNTDKTLHLISDSTIEYNEFIMLLNFIFSKDACWGEIDNDPDFRCNTLRKYISIIDYYHNKNDRSKGYLKSIDFPVDVESLENLNPMRINKISFLPTGFDISKYL